ncbi:MAG: Ig-like domain-containing protein, partial [Longimicrobiales bacterium]|nr:Ig-like domain-containing protein [Longimicrobiales bacterium]
MSRLLQLTLLTSTIALFAACGVTEPDTGGEPPDVAGVSVSAPSTSIGIGATLQLTATVSPSGAATGVTWSSADESRLTVDSNGLVTAVVAPLESGTVRITATSVENAAISGSVDLTITCGPLVSS